LDQASARRDRVEETQDSLQKMIDAVMKSQVVRLVLLGFLVLTLLIPVVMIADLVRERQAREQEAVREVSAKWGQAQDIAGPVIVVPYRRRVVEIGANGKRVTRTAISNATFLPERLDIQGDIESDVRYRGIFSVPVYRLKLNIDAEFAPPDFGQLDLDPADALWDRAIVAVGVTDIRAIQRAGRMTLDGRRLASLPGMGISSGVAAAGIHAEVPRQTLRTLVSKRSKFSLSLLLNGSRRLFFAPVGRDSTVHLKSDWSSPSFQGNWLPAQRRVAPGGFEATWNIPFLGRNYPQAWTSQSNRQEAVSASRFGVDMIMAVDKYRMAERSVKYAGLFILLTFAAVWLIEVLGKFRVHPVQYLLVGFALCVFYLLELSLSEQMEFGLAYAIASVAIVGMIAAYGKAMLRTIGKAAIVGGVVAALYAYLYVVLMNEDYALLAGSVGLFVILALVMFLTRKVNWYEKN